MNRTSIQPKDICSSPYAGPLATNLQDTPVLVLGDLLLDAYVYGRTERVSREAPVPIVVASREHHAAGGAANAAAVVASLSGGARAAGFVGDDENGNLLLQTLNRGGVDLIHEPFKDVETATKTRFLAGSLGTPYQQVLRVDRDLKASAAALEEAHHLLEKALRQEAPNLKAVLISDYGSGGTHEILLHLAQVANDLNLPVLVDSRYGIAAYKLPNAVLKPNAVELEQAVGANDLSDKDLFVTAAARLVADTGARAVLATQGKNGMVWCDEDGVIEVDSLPNPTDSIDVTGAGDGVAAAALLGLANGFAPTDILALATLTATFIVSQHGTACPTPDDLAALMTKYVGES